DLPPPAAAERERLGRVVDLLREAAPGLILTIDPVENRGFEYHTGLAFTIFARQGHAELGRGGRYLAGSTEPATGATLFMDTVLGVLAGPVPAKRLYLPFGTPVATARRLRAEGWVTVAGLTPAADEAAEARRLQCGHVLRAGAPAPSRQEGDVE
ncbi:MAG: ATP phosphoribosyltransferase regulatory subunit, partial [Alphaproteobacteria bacterium]|nr:ATP phosphoribosyltransferase regulatory subunit [Alphaproteobacteria bacterium]